MDVLVIDEVSMVRPDLIDAIDDVLRKVRISSKPFGGVQLLMIGDLSQLSPVITDAERSIISQYYDSPYFYSSHALRKAGYEMVEFKKNLSSERFTFYQSAEQSQKLGCR